MPCDATATASAWTASWPARGSSWASAVGISAELGPQHDQRPAAAACPGVEIGALLVNHQQHRQLALGLGGQMVEQGQTVTRRARRYADDEQAVGLFQLQRMLEVVDRVQIRRELAARLQPGSRQGALEQMAQRR